MSSLQTDSKFKGRSRSGTIMSMMSASTVGPSTPTASSFNHFTPSSPSNSSNQVNRPFKKVDSTFVGHQQNLKPPTHHDEPIPRTTYHFTTLEGLDLELDLYLPKTSSSKQENGVPLMFFLHSGGFVTGSKLGHPLHEIQEAQERGWAVVSPNYPLAPQSTVATQVEAVVRAWKWIVVESKRRAFSNVKGEIKFDLTKLMVAGGSAAASLLILALPKMEPLPIAQLYLYPFLTLMETAGDTADLSDLGSLAPPAQEASASDEKTLTKVDEIIGGKVGGKKAESPMEDFFRLAMHPYASGLPFEPELDVNTKFLFSAAIRPCHYRDSVLGFNYEDSSLIQQRNELDVFQIAKSGQLPPVIIIQGEKDTVTPIEFTKKFVSTLLSAGTRVRFLPLKDQSHVFDFLLPSRNDENGVWNQSLGKGFDFLENEINKVDRELRMRTEPTEKGLDVEFESEVGKETEKEKLSWMRSIGRVGSQFGSLVIKTALEKKKSFNFGSRGVVKKASEEEMPVKTSPAELSDSASTSKPMSKTNSTSTSQGPRPDKLVEAIRSGSSSSVNSLNQRTLLQSQLSCSNSSQYSLALSGSEHSSRRNSALISPV